MEKQLQPKLRFPEFDDKWQNKKLADVITFKAGYAFKSNNMNNYRGTYQIIKMSNVYQNKLQLDRNSSYISDISIKEKEFLLSKGDLVLTLTGTVGKTDYGYSVQINENNKYLLNQRLVALKSINGKSINDYNRQVLLNQRFLYKFFNESKGGTGNQTNVSIEDVKNIKLLIPSLPEQQKIADYLTTIDKKIELLTEKKTELSHYKKAMMQKLFAQEIRFKDENGNDYPEWEEKRLGEVAEIKTGISNRQDSDLNSEYTFFDRSQEIRKSSRYLFDCEVIIVAGEGSEFIPKYFEGKFDLHQRTYAIMDYKNSYGLFLFHYISFKRKYFESQAVGSTVKSLRLPMFEKMPINLPFLLEQQKIANFLSAIDDNIAKVEEQIKETQNFKKAMLQQLFV